MTLAVAVAAPDGSAVDAAEAAVREGGNAFDAALAAAAMLIVAYPHQCALGGDMVALADSGGDAGVEALLSIGAAPAALDVAALRARGSRMPTRGPDSVTVPGVLAGWQQIADSGAALPLRRALDRAADAAAEGTTVSRGLARAIRGNGELIAADPGLRSVLAPAGEAPAAGETLRQPRLAATLRELAADSRSFYEGSIGERLAAGLAALGGRLSAADLRRHRAERTKPLRLEDGGATWFAAPPPSQGATALALIDPAWKLPLVERARIAHAARSTFLGDPAASAIELERLLSPGSFETADLVATGALGRTAGDTVAITAVDSEGRSVALIQSVCFSFGAGILEPETGIVLQNRAIGFTLEPGHPGEAAGGRRPPHTLCPLLARTESGRVAIGCQGGRAQPLILAQVGPAALVPETDLDRLVAEPRWVLGDRDLGFDRETLLVEEGADPGAAVDLPRVAVGRDDRCGHVQVARALGDRLSAAADPRADGRGAEIQTEEER